METKQLAIGSCSQQSKIIRCKKYSKKNFDIGKMDQFFTQFLEIHHRVIRYHFFEINKSIKSWRIAVKSNKREIYYLEISSCTFQTSASLPFRFIHLKEYDIIFLWTNFPGLYIVKRLFRAIMNSQCITSHL